MLTSLLHTLSLSLPLTPPLSISLRYPFPTVFSTCSKKDLAASLEKGVGMCLYNMPEVKVLYGGQKCGNGYVEEGEECDCGELEVTHAHTDSMGANCEHDRLLIVDIYMTRKRGNK